MKHSDIQTTITNEIIELIEEGKTLPWTCPWTNSGVDPMPLNWSTKTHYQGINIMLLWMRAAKMGYVSNAWLTYKQAQALGGQVRKGESGVHCIFYKPVEIKDKYAEVGDEATVVVPFAKAFTVFNLDQVDGLEDLPFATEQPEYNEKDAVDAIDNIASVYCRNTGLVVRHGGDRAYYSPHLDLIRLPTSFHSGDGYASTLAHELGHATGHSSRLNRFSHYEGVVRMKNFDEAYAFEELIAAQVQAYVCATIGVTSQLENHASYIDSWLNRLKRDKSYIFKSAAAAGRAYHHLINGGVIVEANPDVVGEAA